MTNPLMGFAVCVLMAGCGGGPSQQSAAGAGPSGSANGLVPQSAIDNCAGMTPAAAEELLDAPGKGLKDLSRAVGDSGHRQCVFSTDTVPYVGLIFELEPEPTVDAARTAMTTARENMKQASGVIGSVTGSDPGKPPIEEIPAIGDEAFVAEVNDILVFRVANVVVEVTSPESFEARQLVARAVALGLR